MINSDQYTTADMYFCQFVAQIADTEVTYKRLERLERQIGVDTVRCTITDVVANLSLKSPVLKSHMNDSDDKLASTQFDVPLPICYSNHLSRSNRRY